MLCRVAPAGQCLRTASARQSTLYRASGLEDSVSCPVVGRAWGHPAVGVLQRPVAPTKMRRSRPGTHGVVQFRAPIRDSHRQNIKPGMQPLAIGDRWHAGYELLSVTGCAGGATPNCSAGHADTVGTITTRVPARSRSAGAVGSATVKLPGGGRSCWRPEPTLEMHQRRFRPHRSRWPRTAPNHNQPRLPAPDHDVPRVCTP